MAKDIKVIIVKETDILLVSAETNPKAKIIITVENNRLCISED